MDQAELEELRKQFAKAVRTTLPAGAQIERTEVLGYGDDPEIEPGQLLARIVVDPQGATDDGGKDERGRRLEEFRDANRDAIHELRDHMNRLPYPAILELTLGGEPAQPAAEGEGPVRKGPRMRMAGPVRERIVPGGEGPMTPVMARVGPEDLETLDTLITVGIATSRAEAVRWALARIRERPAYEQLRARTREIEELKSQF
jgi:hypothetical protein